MRFHQYQAILDKKKERNKTEYNNIRYFYHEEKPAVQACDLSSHKTGELADVVPLTNLGA